MQQQAGLIFQRLYTNQQLVRSFGKDFDSEYGLDTFISVAETVKAFTGPGSDGIDLNEVVTTKKALKANFLRFKFSAPVTASLAVVGKLAPPELTTPAETQIFADKGIRDTNIHNSSIADELKHKVMTIYVKNTLNQSVTIQVKGNRENSTTGATNIGTTFEVAASTGIEARTLQPTAEGWLPYVYIEASCSVAPTSGNLDAYVIV